MNKLRNTWEKTKKVGIKTVKSVLCGVALFSAAQASETVRTKTAEAILRLSDLHAPSVLVLRARLYARLRLKESISSLKEGVIDEMLDGGYEAEAAKESEKRGMQAKAFQAHLLAAQNCGNENRQICAAEHYLAANDVPSARRMCKDIDNETTQIYFGVRADISARCWTTVGDSARAQAALEVVANTALEEGESIMKIEYALRAIRLNSVQILQKLLENPAVISFDVSGAISFFRSNNFDLVNNEPARLFAGKIAEALFEARQLSEAIDFANLSGRKDLSASYVEFSRKAQAEQAKAYSEPARPKSAKEQTAENLEYVRTELESGKLNTAVDLLKMVPSGTPKRDALADKILERALNEKEYEVAFACYELKGTPRKRAASMVAHIALNNGDKDYAAYYFSVAEKRKEYQTVEHQLGTDAKTSGSLTLAAYHFHSAGDTAAARSIYMDMANGLLAKGKYHDAKYYFDEAGVANPNQHVAASAFEKKDYRVAAMYFEDAEILEKAQECWRLYADEIALPLEADHLISIVNFQQLREAAEAYTKANLPERAHAMRVLAVSAAHQSSDSSAVDYRGLAEVHRELRQDAEAQEALLNEAAQVHAGAWNSVGYTDDLYQKTGAAPEIIARKKAEVEEKKGNAFESAGLFEKAGDKPAACDQYLQALDDVDGRKKEEYLFTVQKGDKETRRVDKRYFTRQLAALDGVQNCCM